MRKRVYIAGPMSKGDRIENLYHALLTYRKLIELGYAPICPQFSYFVAELNPLEHQQWLDIDLPWVQAADAILRIPGESKGADQEVETAYIAGVPVFYHIETLDNYFRGPL